VAGGDGSAGPLETDAILSAPDSGLTQKADGIGGQSPDAGATTTADGPAPPSGIWQPKPGTSWHWQLVGSVDQSVNAVMYDVDLFNNTVATIAAIKAKGHVVVCYFSAGSYEDWRPDAKDFPQSALGSKMDGWDELWLDIRSTAVLDVMKKRLDLAQSKGCDGVEPDNVDGYANSTGFALSSADQLAYNKALAAEAHKRGLSVGLKNNLDQVQQLEPYFDFAVNEECVQYNECDVLSAFINAGKAVFHVEYSPATTSGICPKVKALGFDSQIKKLDLDAWFLACWT